VEKAAEAERRIIEELRQMGSEVFHSWGRRQQQKKEQEYDPKPGVNRKEKKLYWYTRLGTIEIEEQIYTQGRRGREMRPFCESAEVECRGYSLALQRTLTDFGADGAFVGAAAKLKEHYGIEVPGSAIRGFTEEHGEAMPGQEKQKRDWPDRAGVRVLISEMDGSMLPVVEVAEPGAGAASVDRRKTRQVSWKEARLALAHEPGSVTPIFGATLGNVEQAGERLAVCALEAGGGSRSQDPWGGGWGGLDHRADGGAVWQPSTVSGRFLSSVRLPFGGRRPDRGKR
jgi:hypothetical protein